MPGRPWLSRRRCHCRNRRCLRGFRLGKNHRRPSLASGRCRWHRRRCPATRRPTRASMRWRSRPARCRRSTRSRWSRCSATSPPVAGRCWWARTRTPQPFSLRVQVAAAERSARFPTRAVPVRPWPDCCSNHRASRREPAVLPPSPAPTSPRGAWFSRPSPAAPRCCCSAPCSRHRCRYWSSSPVLSRSLPHGSCSPAQQPPDLLFGPRQAPASGWRGTAPCSGRPCSGAAQPSSTCTPNWQRRSRAGTTRCHVALGRSPASLRAHHRPGPAVRQRVALLLGQLPGGPLRGVARGRRWPRRAAQHRTVGVAGGPTAVARHGAGAAACRARG